MPTDPTTSAADPCAPGPCISPEQHILPNLPTDTAATERTHTRVRSVHGPTWCCQECSTSAKRYVEWPCVGKALETFGLIGGLMLDGIKREFESYGGTDV